MYFGKNEMVPVSYNRIYKIMNNLYFERKIFEKDILIMIDRRSENKSILYFTAYDEMCFQFDTLRRNNSLGMCFNKCESVSYINNILTDNEYKINFK